MSLIPKSFFTFLYYCHCLNAELSVIVIAIIDVIAFIAFIEDGIGLAVVPDDDDGLVEDPFEEPCIEPTGTPHKVAGPYVFHIIPHPFSTVR